MDYGILTLIIAAVNVADKTTTTMDNTILTAIIAAASASVGAIIPSLFSYLGKRKEYENDKKAKLEDLQRRTYYEYIEALQKIINSGNRDNFLLLQASTNKLLLYAGSKLSSLINQYYNDITQRSLQRKPLTLEEQTKYQTYIFNAMRKELGIAKEKLDTVSMVCAGF